MLKKKSELTDPIAEIIVIIVITKTPLLEKTNFSYLDTDLLAFFVHHYK